MYVWSLRYWLIQTFVYKIQGKNIVCIIERYKLYEYVKTTGAWRPGDTVQHRIVKALLNFWWLCVLIAFLIVRLYENYIYYETMTIAIIWFYVYLRYLVNELHWYHLETFFLTKHGSMNAVAKSIHPVLLTNGSTQSISDGLAYIQLMNRLIDNLWPYLCGTSLVLLTIVYSILLPLPELYVLS